MAEVDQQLKAETKSKKAISKRRKARKTPGSATSKRAREAASRIRAQERAARKDGLDRLRQVADQRVGDNAEELADKLTGKALKGDLTNLKILLELAAKKKVQAEPVKKQGMTLAQRWMEDLRVHGEWKGDQEEGLGEVGEGGVEPENLE
jgi:hypothetical protein